MHVEFASKDPSQLERYGITEYEGVAAATDPNIKTVQENTKGINYGLN